MSARRLYGRDFEEWIEDWLVHGLDAHSKVSPDATMRWLFCWDGDDPRHGFDCGCCLIARENWPKYGMPCGCPCHGRVTSLASWMRFRYEQWLAAGAPNENADKEGEAG